MVMNMKKHRHLLRPVRIDWAKRLQKRLNERGANGFSVFAKEGASIQDIAKGVCMLMDAEERGEYTDATLEPL